MPDFTISELIERLNRGDCMLFDGDAPDGVPLGTQSPPGPRVRLIGGAVSLPPTRSVSSLDAESDPSNRAIRQSPAPLRLAASLEFPRVWGTWDTSA
jgi:hypothetical protein